MARRSALAASIRYERTLKVYSPPGGTVATAYAARPDGKTYAFTRLTLDGAWLADGDVSANLVQTPTGWTYTARDGTTETYDTSGRLLALTDPRGTTQVLSYDASGRLNTVTYTFGHTLSFAYDTTNRLSALTTPDGQVIAYGYDARNNLIRTRYPDGTARVYLYENTSFPNALTGISSVDSAGAVTRLSATTEQCRARVRVLGH